MKVVFLGLSITSSWGNGHATNYRALVAELVARGYDVLFCERDVPWYANSRDLDVVPGGRLLLYGSLAELQARAGEELASADLIVLGSYVPEGVAVAELVLGLAGGATAFYDIDTPVTLAKLAAGDEEYISAPLIPRFDLYLSFTGGPTLGRLEREFHARRAVAFHCLVDESSYRPVATMRRWDLGYLGTYSSDRQPQLDSLLIRPARALPHCRFVVAGPQYPQAFAWPENVARIEHLPPVEHAGFYSAQRFTLNVTRAAMRAAGWSPSVRLFEAAACGTAIISDRWPGLEESFTPGEEILIADGPEEVAAILRYTSETARSALARRARARVLAEHTAARRVDQLEGELALLSQRLRMQHGASA